MSDAESDGGMDVESTALDTESAPEAGSAVDLAPAPSDAFSALGGETRTDTLRALFEAEREAGAPVARSFTDLFEASDESTTAGFAYHLRQLTDIYLRKVPAGEDGRADDAAGEGAADDGDDADAEAYRLTAAGRRVARAIAAGTLTDSADRDHIDLAEPCPFCGDHGLAASGDDTILTVACDACDREVLALPFPPGGYRTHDDDRLPAAVDRYYRGRITTMRDGTCPECGGEVDTAVALDGGDGTTEHYGDQQGSDDGDGSDGASHACGGHTPPVARARMTCRACGYRLRCPVTLTLLEEPAVVAAFHDAGVDLGARPLWNVGDEWRERVVSTDPVAVRVTATVGGVEVACFVGRDLTVVHTDRAPVDGDDDPEHARTRPADDAATGTAGTEDSAVDSSTANSGESAEDGAGTATA